MAVPAKWKVDSAPQNEGRQVSPRAPGKHKGGFVASLEGFLVPARWHVDSLPQTEGSQVSPKAPGKHKGGFVA
jgi:hypothetical protein